MFRLSFIADLLSIPVIIGFLAGIGVHIFASQAPAILGVEAASGSTLNKLWALALAAPHANPWTLGLGLGVYVVMELGEVFFARAPSALIALIVATALTAGLGLEDARRGDARRVAAGLARDSRFPSSPTRHSSRSRRLRRSSPSSRWCRPR